MIIGISAGRKVGVTSSAVKAILESSEVEFEYISLSGKKINGCIGCVRCADDNICKQKDDWNEISDKLLKADAIVFGAPNYGGTINALGHAFLERMFCFRHREVFSLAGKLAVIVSVEYAREKENIVNNFIKKVFNTQMMAIVDSVSATGYSQCYTCGFGENCGVGNVVRDHGFINEIKDEHYPSHFKDQAEAVFQAHRVGKLLGSILKNKKTTS
jgi:multimeric flavodoxin WrbA